MPSRHRRGLYAPELLEARIAPATFIVRNLSDAAVDSLRNLIGQANATPEADTIVFDPAILPGKITLSLEISILNPLTIKGPGVDLLTVSGNDLVRIFNIDYGASLKPTTLSGLTLTDGRTAQDGGAVRSLEPLTLKNVVVRSSYAGNDGGGVFVSTPGKVSISGSRIVHNEAINGGGGLYLRSQAGVSIIKTVIADNRADNGGGLYAQATGAKSVVLIDGSTISNNVALGSNGGGLQFRSVDNSRLVMKNSLVTGNSAQTAGGGLYAASGHLLISKTTFSNNNADRGGAIAADKAQTVTVSGSRFLGNQATNATLANPGGGALYLQGPNTVLKIAGTVFAGNHSATYGGAIAHTGPMTMTVTGSNFLGNTAAFSGGVFDLSDGAMLTVSSSLLSGNSALSGGAVNIKEAATFTLKSSSVSGNSAENGGGGAIFAQPTSVLNLTSNKFTENHALYGGAIDLIGNMGGQGVTATLSGNLFQANMADKIGGAVATSGASVFTSKGDKFIGNVTAAGAGGGVYLRNTAGTFITGSLFQGNVAGSGSGGGLSISGGGAILSGVKVLDNIAGPGGRGGGLRIADVNVFIFKSVISGNVANDGGGIVSTGGVTTLDAATRAATKGNSASINPNTSGV
jgi:fibronectin-binding autotransporter adhesin